MRCVVFDLDGTLVNTLEDIRAAINYAIVAFEGNAIGDEECRRYIGHGLRNALSRAALEHGAKIQDESDFANCYALMMEYYKRHVVVFSKPYDGIISLLESLKAKGYKLAVLSNKRDELIKEIVKVLFGENLFDYVLGATDSLPLKPDPRALYSVLENLNCSKEEAVYIGDSEVDYKTAQNASVPYIIVSYGFRTKDELKSAKIDSIDHIPSVLNIEKCFEKEA